MSAALKLVIFDVDGTLAQVYALKANGADIVRTGKSSVVVQVVDADDLVALDRDLEAEVEGVLGLFPFLLKQIDETDLVIDHGFVETAPNR